MKISIILIGLLFVNTSALFSETISTLVTGVNPWVLVLVEVLLVISYYVNGVVKDFRKISKIDMRNLNLFVLKNKKSA